MRCDAMIILQKESTVVVAVRARQDPADSLRPLVAADIRQVGTRVPTASPKLADGVS